MPSLLLAARAVSSVWSAGCGPGSQSSWDALLCLSAQTLSAQTVTHVTPAVTPLSSVPPPPDVRRTCR
ncbi:hypothetical protein NOCA1130349 [metagenome]|uniref:Uncharacterized protein n=1 Tax=metagenome TaxID=256318 RepID=A0A2P2C7Q5_9ZZZZ